MEERKDMIKKSVAAIILIILIMIAVSVAIRYSVEGEENMPFTLSKIVIGSMVVSEDNQTPDSTEGTIVQNNGIYFYINKSEKYYGDAVIKSVEISNIDIIKQPKKGEVKVYFPSTKENEKFTYSDDFLLEGDTLTYKGASKNDTTALEINNQGGVIAIAFGNTKLGEYKLSEKALTIDGTMLKDMDITDEDIKFTVKFDLIICVKGKKYKTTIELDLPASEITTKGKSSMEITDTSKYVFKRIKE